MSNNTPRRHHYVPEFYQAQFADADGRLWLYDRTTKALIKAHPRVICCERDLYTIDPDGVRDAQIETRILSQIDGDAANTIRQFTSQIALSPERVESFSIFMALQITRNPAFRALTLRNYKAMADEYLRIGFTDVDRARHLLENYRRDSGDESAANVTAESLVEAVVGGHMKIHVTEGPFLQHMLSQLEFLSRWIASFEWRVLEAPKESGFIISDYPFVLVPPREHPDALGLGFVGTKKYFPLTNALCLEMGGQGWPRSYEHISKEDTRIVNQNMAVNSERFIMGPSRTQLERVIERSRTAESHPEPRCRVDRVESDRDSALYRFTQWPRRSYFYPRF